MFFTPSNIHYTGGEYVLPCMATARANAALCKEIFSELWYSCTYHASSLTVEPIQEPIFRLGDAKPLPLDGKSYAVNITESGICVSADSEKNLLYGFYALLDCIGMTRPLAASVKTCTFSEKASMTCRMAHFCVFPETELWELERFIRLCALLKYTHLIVEFWGMYAYRCEPALSWKKAYTTAEIAPLMHLAHSLGLEIVPMFNCLGHASASRVMHGKHVVLDNDPSLQYLFDETGWSWRFGTEPVETLQTDIRDELCELCGDGEYFHIGCDEIYGFDYSERSIQAVCAHINHIAADLKKKGRKTILWGDMFVHRRATYNPKNQYSAACPSDETAERMLSLLDKDVIIADWQYDCNEYPVETALFFKEHGFTTMLCPWDCSVPKINSCVQTVKKEALYGIIHTTWHTLSRGTLFLGKTARSFYSDAPDERDGNISIQQTHTAELLRKAYPTQGEYRKSGWSKIEVGDLV